MPKHEDSDDDGNKITTVTMRVRNREWLKSLGRKGQTYDDILDSMRDLLKQKNMIPLL